MGLVWGRAWRVLYVFGKGKIRDGGFGEDGKVGCDGLSVCFWIQVLRVIPYICTARRSAFVFREMLSDFHF